MQPVLELHELEHSQLMPLVQQRLLADFISRYKASEQPMIEYPNISYPGMGFIIAYYTYARYTKKMEYEQYADNLLENILSELSETTPLCLDKGLLGIGCGLIYLLENNYIGGKEDEILSDIDSLLITALDFTNGEAITDWYGCLHYFRLRAFGTLSVENTWYKLVLRQFGIQVLDCLMLMVEKGLKPDENILSEVRIFHKMKLYPEKTTEILGMKQKRKKADPSINTSRVTFVIPLRVDSPERERNLDLLVEHLTKFEYADVRILEGDKNSLYHLKRNYQNVVYSFVEDPDPVFHRTKYLNILLREAESPIVGIWDTDVMLTDCQIKEALTAIKEGKAVMSFPYDGRFYMLSQEESELFVKDHSFDRLYRGIDNRYLTCGPNNAVGGAFMVNKELYLQAGGENEHFYGWSHEDSERVKRMQILDLPVFNASGPLFHLYHPRKENSWYGSKELELQSIREFLRICGMTQSELWNDIRSW